MTTVRPAAVAGTFYPGDPRELDATVQYHLSRAAAEPGPAPKAIIAPHAGYIYSAPIAAAAYVRIRPAAERIRRVVLLGPCHRVAVRGLALSGADAFATPLGDVPVDRDAADALLDLAQVSINDASHVEEHSLEVHLPFLQVILGDFSIVPLVVGEATAGEVAEVIERLWGGEETLVVVSSDLSHYLDYDTARRLDQITCDAIEAFEPQRIGHDQACGRIPVGGLLDLAKRRGLTITTLDLRNSGDTAGARDRVVGYGAWAFVEDAAADAPRRDTEDKAHEEAFAARTRALLDLHGPTLLHMAAASIEHGLAQGCPLPVNTAEHHRDLAGKAACFVTLKHDGTLRGCIGSAGPERALLVDVVENSFAAAFRDPRFSRLCSDEMEGLSLSVAVLSAAQPMAFADEADLLSQLRPGADGLIIEDEGRRALFLPAVWDGVPKPEEFLGHLKAKAKLAADHWSANLRAWRFVTVEVSAEDLDDPSAIWSGRRFA